MKTALMLLLLALAGNTASAQSNPPVCGIYYDYNAVGQRIKRSYDCRAIPDGGGGHTPGGGGSTSRMAPPGREGAVLSTPEKLSSGIEVYPNPTAGPYTIALSGAPKEPVHYHWYNERGQILSSGIMKEQKASGNIASWADGVYLLQVYTPAGTESFRVVKVTSAH